MKFMHTMGAIGIMGAMACLLVLLSFIPTPTSLLEYALMRAAMDGIATWIVLPSLGLTLMPAYWRSPPTALIAAPARPGLNFFRAS